MASTLPGSDILLLRLSKQPFSSYPRKGCPLPTRLGASPLAPHRVAAAASRGSVLDNLRREMQAWREERGRAAAAPSGSQGWQEAAGSVGERVPRLKTLPLSPYPATTGTKVAMRVYRDPMGRITEREEAEKWNLGDVIEYETPHGKKAEVSGAVPTCLSGLC